MAEDQKPAKGMEQSFTTEELRTALESMPPELRAQVQSGLIPRERLDDYTRRISSHLLETTPHINFLQKLVERARVEQTFTCLSLPPRHAKTTTLLHGLSWWLDDNPADTNAYFSYSDIKGRGKSKFTRRLARRAGVQLIKDSQSMAEWRTPEGGGLLAGGAGGGLTGDGVTGLFVCDDPFPNRKKADSIAYRDEIWEWFTEVVLTRLEGASVIVVHTRWHPDDLIGRIAANDDYDDWNIVNIPAIAEEDDVLDREPGEALWPDKFPLAYLDRMRKKLGSWSFDALYQGRPRPRGEVVFGDPTYYDPETFDLSGCRIIIAGDPAATASTRADYSVALALAVRGHGVDSVGYILDMWRGQVEVPVYVAKVAEMAKRYGGARIAMEAVGGFKAVPQMLRMLDSSLDIVEVKMTADKFTRAQPAAAAWNDGRLRVPIGMPLTKPLVAEVTAFTGVGDVHDDIIDTLAHAWNALAVAVQLAGPINFTGTRWQR